MRTIHNISPLGLFILAVLANLALVSRILINFDPDSRSDAAERETHLPASSSLRASQAIPTVNNHKHNNKNQTTAEPTSTLVPTIYATMDGAQSQDGVSRDHMKRDGEWMDNIDELYDCPTMADHFKDIKQEDRDAFNNIPNKRTHWNKYYDAYHAVVDPNFEKLPSAEYQEKAWSVPIEVKFSPENGRGVYAKSHIKKGKKVWTAHNAALFANSHQYREFLEHLFADAASKQAACDTQAWYDIESKYLEDYTGSHDFEFMICQSFDEGTLFNEDLTPTQSKINLGAVESGKFDNQCGGYYYRATRDIEPGEELLISYDVDVLMQAGFVAMGLQAYDANDIGGTTPQNPANTTGTA